MLQNAITKIPRITGCLAAVVLALGCQSSLAEVVLKLRENARCESTVVTLRDIVEVVGGDEKKVSGVLGAALGPSPRPGSPQRWYKSDIVQHLQARGIDRRAIRWSGPEHTTLTREPIKMVTYTGNLQPAFVNERMQNAASLNLSQAIQTYLQQVTGSQTQWEVVVQPDAKDVKTLLNRRNILEIGGGSDPIEGPQQFIVRLRNADRTTRTVRVNAEVGPPEMVVVASRPLRRDEVLTAEALKLAVLPKQRLAGQKYFTRLEDVLGKQLRRSLSTGLLVTEQIIGAPVVVERMQLVTVECRVGTIVVKSPGKALSSGAVGELVEVELEGRRRLTGSVVDSMTVRVSPKTAAVGR